MNLGLPDKLLRALLAALSIDGEGKAAELPKASLKLLAEGIAGCPFKVATIGGWEEAMATRGGVELGEVDSKTMESRLTPGLYFAGEVLDIDGDSGGYNLQAAFSTGMLAGRSAESKG
ncbi:MAG: NAD(P)/FAD-dependent oxidoreductase [Armatimonadetes bacterium]|nr:NAD(P)/FAD-dependent oxidoreductase [Armatimonadota bacterium]